MCHYSIYKYEGPTLTKGARWFDVCLSCPHLPPILQLRKKDLYTAQIHDLTPSVEPNLTKVLRLDFDMCFPLVTTPLVSFQTTLNFRSLNFYRNNDLLHLFPIWKVYSITGITSPLWSFVQVKLLIWSYLCFNLPLLPTWCDWHLTWEHVPIWWSPFRDGRWYELHQCKSVHWPGTSHSQGAPLIRTRVPGYRNLPHIVQVVVLTPAYHCICHATDGEESWENMRDRQSKVGNTEWDQKSLLDSERSRRPKWINSFETKADRSMWVVFL